MSACKDRKTGKWCARVRYTDWQGEARLKLNTRHRRRARLPVK